MYFVSYRSIYCCTAVLRSYIRRRRDATWTCNPTTAVPTCLQARQWWRLIRHVNCMPHAVHAFPTPPRTPANDAAVDPSVLLDPFRPLFEPLEVAKELKLRRRELADLKPSTTFLDDRPPPPPPAIPPRPERRLLTPPE